VKSEQICPIVISHLLQSFSGARPQLLEHRENQERGKPSFTRHLFGQQAGWEHDSDI